MDKENQKSRMLPIHRSLLDTESLNYKGTERMTIEASRTIDIQNALMRKY